MYMCMYVHYIYIWMEPARLQKLRVVLRTSTHSLYGEACPGSIYNEDPDHHTDPDNHDHACDNIDTNPSITIAMTVTPTAYYSYYSRHHRNQHAVPKC